MRGNPLPRRAPRPPRRTRLVSEGPTPLKTAAPTPPPRTRQAHRTLRMLQAIPLQALRVRLRGRVALALQALQRLALPVKTAVRAVVAATLRDQAQRRQAGLLAEIPPPPSLTATAATAVGPWA